MSNDLKIKELGGIDLVSTMNTLLSGDMRPLEFDRLCISLGANRKALNDTMVLDYFLRCQSSHYEQFGRQYKGFWYRTEKQIIERTYSNQTAVRESIKSLKVKGLISTSRKSSYKGQVKYRVEINALRKFLEEKEEVYINHLDGYDTRTTADLKARKEAIKKEAERLELLNKTHNKFDWDYINENINVPLLTPELVSNLVTNAHLSGIEIFVLFAITRGFNDYWKTNIKWNAFTFNTLMKNLSGISLKDAKDNNRDLTPRGFQDQLIFEKISCKCIIDAFKVPLNETEKGYVNSGKGIQPFLVEFNLIKDKPDYKSLMTASEYEERFGDFIYTDEGYFNGLMRGQDD